MELRIWIGRWIGKEANPKTRSNSAKINSFARLAFYLNHQTLPLARKRYQGGIISLKLPLKFLEERNILVVQNSSPLLTDYRPINRNGNAYTKSLKPYDRHVMPKAI